MSHNEKRTSWAKEGIISLSTGVIYGVTVVAVGHVISFNLLISY
jgi:hypothetical protein